MKQKCLFTVVLTAVLIVSLSAQKIERVIEPHPLPVGYPLFTNVFGIAFDRSGAKWIATNMKEAGALIYNEIEWIPIIAVPHNHHEDEDCDTIKGLIAHHSSCIAIDSKNNVWVGSSGHGISKKFSDTLWATYTKNCGLSGDVIRNIFIVKDTVWVATMNGLTRIVGDTNITIYKDELPDTNVICLTIDKTGTLWVGTDGGLIKFNGTSWIKEYPVLGAKCEIFALTVDDNGNVWVSLYQSGTSGRTGLYVYDGSSWIKKSDEVFNCLVFDKKGHLWAGADPFYEGVGVWNYNGNSWVHYTTEDNLLHNSVKNIAVDERGTVWIGCPGGLTKIYDTIIRPQSAIQNIKDKNSFISIYPNPTTGQLTIDNGQLTIESVEIYDVVGRKQKIIVNYPFSTANSIDVSTLPQGIYFVKLKTDKGIVTKKFVKA